MLENLRSNLKTRRLYLRPLNAADLWRCLALDADPGVLEMMGGWLRYGGEPPRRATMQPKYRARLLYRPHRLPWFGFWGAWDRNTHQFIGWFQFEGWTKPSEAMIGWRLHKRYWGRGYATEGARALIDVAFKHWGVKRIIADTTVDHAASRRVMEKLGMRAYREEVSKLWGPIIWYAISPRSLRRL